MEIGSMVIAVVGVAGTLGATLLTQRGAARAKRRELELVHGHDAVRENLLLRRTCYVGLNRDARQFTTALNRHLHAMRERGIEEADRTALDAAKDVFRDQYSEAQMIAPGSVLTPVTVVNHALSDVYGQVKRLERGEPAPGESMEAAAEAQQGIWGPLRVMRAAMRADLGVPDGG
ncbi:hypothetical protein ABT024_33820 [Streptomyces sp. NPDC002812]|uniref:hypothetical protein n=1 Tax=unclassified Streptomyces TaxID=2593676 RepID=UPI00331CB72A